MSTTPTVSSQPSIWRLGMVDWRFAFGVYASVVVGQFLINSTVSAIMYATSDDFSQHVDQAAVNAAFTTGIYPPHHTDHHDDDVSAGSVSERSVAPHPGNCRPTC